MRGDERAYQPGSGDRRMPPKCFLHVPKSGGSSVHAALELALAPGSLAPRRFDSAFSGTADDIALLRQEARAHDAATATGGTRRRISPSTARRPVQRPRSALVPALVGMC
jgi:hypothetical protein